LTDVALAGTEIIARTGGKAYRNRSPFPIRPNRNGGGMAVPSRDCGSTPNPTVELTPAKGGP